MDAQSLENRVNALLEAVEGSNQKSYEFQEYADALKTKFEELTTAAGQIPDLSNEAQQSLASKFETIRQRVDINSSYVGTDGSIFKDFLTSTQEFIYDMWAKLVAAFGGITGGDEDSPTPEPPTAPAPPTAPSQSEQPTMSMAEPPPPPPMGAGPLSRSSAVPEPPRGRNDRVGPGSNFSKANIRPSDTQQYLRTFDPNQKALDREMKAKGYQKVGPGGIRREGDGSIRRKSQYGGAVGSLSNFLGDVGNTLTKNRRIKP